MLTAVLAGMLLGGCVQAEKTRYARHLATTVDSGPAANDELAMAFKLDSYADTGTAVAAAALATDVLP